MPGEQHALYPTDQQTTYYPYSIIGSISTVQLIDNSSKQLHTLITLSAKNLL